MHEHAGPALGFHGPHKRAPKKAKNSLGSCLAILESRMLDTTELEDSSCLALGLQVCKHVNSSYFGAHSLGYLEPQGKP